MQLIGILMAMIIGPVLFGHALRRAERRERRKLPAEFWRHLGVM